MAVVFLSPTNGYRYFLQKGLMSELNYPTNGRPGKCNYDYVKAIYQPVSWNYFLGLFNMDTQTAYSNLRRCSYVTIQGFRAPRDYKSGILNPADCNGSGSYYGLITVVGYGYDAITRQNYWVITNHQGPNYGEKGFMKIGRNDVQKSCGITSPFWNRPNFS